MKNKKFIPFLFALLTIFVSYEGNAQTFDPNLTHFNMGMNDGVFTYPIAYSWVTNKQCAIFNQYAIVATSGALSGNPVTKSAYIYKRYCENGSAWKQYQEIPIHAGSFDESTYGVNISGNYAAVYSVSTDPISYKHIHSIRVFKKTPSTYWLEVKDIQFVDGIGSSAFAISLSENNLAISRISANVNYNNEIYIYHANQGGTDNWGLAQTIDISSSLSGVFSRLSLDKENLAVITDQGIYMLTANTSEWLSTSIYSITSINPPSSFSYQYYNIISLDIDMSGNNLIIGDPYAYNEQGAAFVYENMGGVWVFVNELTESSLAFQGAARHFGASVGISDTHAAVGVMPDINAPYGEYDSDGNVHVFGKAQGWGLVSNPPLKGSSNSSEADTFGMKVDIWDSAIVTTAFHYDNMNYLDSFTEVYLGTPMDTECSILAGRANIPQENAPIKQLQITPNPVANDLKLSGNSEMEYEVRLQDGQGKQIGLYTGKLADVEATMNKQVRNLKAGMYFVQFKPSKGKAEVKKFVKVN